LFCSRPKSQGIYAFLKSVFQGGGVLKTRHRLPKQPLEPVQEDLIGSVNHDQVRTLRSSVYGWFRQACFAIGLYV
jgi:hypothetical protein